MNFKLTASGRQTIAPAWEYDEMTWGSLVQPPLLAGDRLVCLTDKALFALDIYTGKEVANEDGRFPHRFRRSFDEHPAPTHCRGIVYFMDRKKLLARQLSDGNIPTRLVDGQRVPRWTPPEIAGVTSLNANDNVVVVTHAEPEASVSGFDPATGAPLWKAVKVSAFSPGPVTATREAILFVSGGHLFAVNILSGDTRFDFTPSGAADPLSVADAPQVGELKDKTIVIVTGAAVYGVDLHNGKQLWTFRAPGSAAKTEWYRPAISERYNCVVVANKNNEVFMLELMTGAQKWQAKVPNVEHVSIVGDKVYAGGRGRNTELHVFNLISGESKCSVNLEDPGQMGLMTGRGILLTPGEERVRAFVFGDQNAMLFNGDSSRIAVTTKGEQLNFRQTDFTIEAWICTTGGGEVVSAFPSGAGNEAHGFRLNVSDQGRLRFAIMNRNASSSFAASSALTNVADGSWHHIAAVRRGQGVEVYVDGISVEVNTAVKGSQALDINNVNALMIGAFDFAGQPPSHFEGLIRELRVWDIALDAAKLQSRMQLVLTGMEPQMLGYWRLDESDVSELQNYTPRYVYEAQSKDVVPFVTELALDKSTFPYLLDQVKLQWPYAGHWSARGDKDLKTGPALDRSGVLAFGTSNSIYGVLESDGARAWSKATPAGASTPVAADGGFYCVTGQEGLIAIDAHTGDVKPVEGFDGLIKTLPPTGTFLPAPASDARYIAAVSPDGEVWVVEKIPPAGTKRTAWKWKAPAKIAGDLAIHDKRLYLTAGAKLYQLDPDKKQDVSLAISGPHVVHGDSIFCHVSADRVTRFASSDLTKPLASFDVPAGVTVTGLAASSDFDLLVVATDKGELHGLTFATLAKRWTARVPAGSGSSSHSLHAPSISGRSVFCTSTSGAVAAVDAMTGEVRGLFFEPTSIKTAPVVDSGEIYFGCRNAPAEANLLDGALHSVVFGETHVLRLGVDRTGARETAPSYVSVKQGSLLKLLGVWECCVEAWVNTKEGGEVLSIAPNGDSHYGLRLWLDRDGKIHFTCVDLPDDAGASWEQITSEANSSACDGKWHHIAVTRSARDEVKIYLDSVALSVTNKLDTVAQPTLSPGLKIFIGADATAAAPSNFLAGMIGEVRVWDTYLTATRISARMHEKLIGNEPDLLAYWNFDKLSLQDASRNGHDGKLEARDSSAGYWLADLNFTHHAYPYIETTGRMLQQGAAGSQGELANTIYQLTVAVRKGDGTPLADHDVRLWYVRHRGEDCPDKIKAASSTGNLEIKAVLPSHGDEESIVGITGKDGKVVFRLTTSQPDHGPSLDIRPAFLPANERYHVNVLIDSQRLDKPAPPRLEAQATLIQDYHWSPGDKVNEERDRQTWRAVITARNSDGRARPGERFQLWATEHCEIEVDGRTYPINPHNYQAFTADEKGELTVAIAADDIRAPKLLAWAGFMHREERYTIPLDQAVHKDLAELSGKELTKPRMKNWSPEYDAKTDNEPFVDKGYEEHAGKVANAIQHVMSVSQEPAPMMRAGLRKKRTRLLRDRRNFGDMQPVDKVPSADAVYSLPTLRHIEREAPLEPESFMQSLRSMDGFEDSIGFVFTKNDLELRPLKSVRQLHSTFKMAPTPEAPKLLGNWLEDAWNAIENAAEAVWNEAKRIAIYIADTVTLVIEYTDKVVQKVVQSIKEAIEAVVHVFKMIGKFIADVVRFLTALFDWGAILEAHEILKQIATDQMHTVRQIIGRGSDDFAKMITGVFTGKVPAIDTTKHSQLTSTAGSARASDPHPQVQAQVNSVPGKYVNDKVDEHDGEINYNIKPSSTSSQSNIDQDTSSQASQLTNILGGSLTDPLGLSFAELFESIKDLISGDVEKIIRTMLKPLLSNFAKMGEALDLAWAALNAPIEIPFLSDLYKWITGQKLTLLDVTCLALAIPTHIGYTVFSLLTTGEIRTFAEDAKHFKTYQLTAPQFYGEAPVVQPKLLGDAKVARNRAMHWSYFAFCIAYTGFAGFLKVGQIQENGKWKDNDDMTGMTMPLMLNGLVSKTLLYTAGMTEENWNDEDIALNSAIYAITSGLDIYTAYDAFFDRSVTSKNVQRAVDFIKIGVSIAGCVLLGLKIDMWVNKKSNQSDLFHTRDVLNCIGMMFAFDDTSMFLKVAPGAALLLACAEIGVKAAAPCLHLAAVLDE